MQLAYGIIMWYNRENNLAEVLMKNRFNIGTIKDKANGILADIKQEDTPNRSGWERFCGIVKKTCKWIFRLRSVILSLPVALATVYLAFYNTVHLPRLVGVNLLPSGAYSIMVDRSIAVIAPVALTALCLLMVLGSRRVLYPWLISLFSLVVPVLILFTNVFPS